MNEKLSALMDGELDREEAESIIKSLNVDHAYRERWDMFHMIGDAMRGQCEVRRANTDAIFARLADEPTVLAPAAIRHSPLRGRMRIALSLAASVVTLSAIGIIAVKTQQGVAVAPINLVQNDKPRPVVETTPQQNAAIDVNDYLLVHRQFANPDALQQAAFKAR